MMSADTPQQLASGRALPAIVRVSQQNCLGGRDLNIKPFW